MKEDFDKLLSEIDVEIAKIDLYGIGKATRL